MENVGCRATPSTVTLQAWCLIPGPFTLLRANFLLTMAVSGMRNPHRRKQLPFDCRFAFSKCRIEGIVDHSPQTSPGSGELGDRLITHTRVCAQHSLETRRTPPNSDKKTDRSTRPLISTQLLSDPSLSWTYSNTHTHAPLYKCRMSQATGRW